MSNKFQAAAKVLLAAKDQINVLLTGPDEELHRLRLEQTLQREADYIVMVTGSGDMHSVETQSLGPATTIGGKPISKIRKITEADLLPSDDAVLNLKQQVENALVYFGPESNSAGILANIPELIIRGVAKKAGLKVTKDDPKELTVEFIDQVKAALVEKNIVPVKTVTDDMTDEERERLEALKNPSLPGITTVSDQPTEGMPGMQQLEGQQPIVTPPAPAVETTIETSETIAQPTETNQPKPETKKAKTNK